MRKSLKITACEFPLSGGGIALGLLGTMFAATLALLPSTSRAKLPSAAQEAPPATHATLSGVPLSFEPNVGQAGDDVKYLAHGAAYSIALTERGAVLSLKPEHSSSASAVQPLEMIRLDVQGARQATKPVAEEALAGRTNYYIGNDRSKWHTGVATYGRVRYAGVYPGVDLVYYGTQGRLEYDFAVAPGANPKAIGLRFDGSQRLRLDSAGNLKVRAQDGEISFLRPVAYQEMGARRVPVEASYRLSGNTLHFKLGAYDHSARLIIDPILSYFSYLGGGVISNIGAETPTGGPPTNSTGNQAAAVDAAGDLYVTGYTTATDFPTKAAFAPAPAKQSGATSWAFVTKFAPDAKTLVFSTYIGGSLNADRGYSIAVDASGNAIVVGETGNDDFPTTGSAYQKVCSPYWGTGAETSNCSGSAGGGPGPISAFVSKFSPSGALLDSTFLGGSGTQNVAYAVAVDATGRAYVAGWTYAGANVPTGAGLTKQVGYPTTAGAALAVPPYMTVNGNQVVLDPFNLDAFISVFDPTLSTLVYSSLLGDSQISNNTIGFKSSANTLGTAVTVDATGNFYVAGYTGDPLLQVTAGALQTTVASCGVLYPSPNPDLNGACGFVAKFSPVGGATSPTQIYGTYLGHMPNCCGVNQVTAIVADAAGDAYAAGYANQAGFPTTTGAYQTGCQIGGAGSCGNVEFIAKLNPTGTALLAATLFGNATPGGTDGIYEVGPIALDAVGNVIISGIAFSGLAQVNPLPVNAGGSSSTVAPFVATLDPTLSTLLFSTFVGNGSTGQQAVDGLALDVSGNIYLAGNVGQLSSSAATPGAFQQTPGYGLVGGGNSTNGFVAKIILTVPTTTTLSASPATAAAGTAITLTATVAENPGTAVPTGSVIFRDGATVLGTGTANGTGIAIVTTSTLGVGTHSVTAAYGGDSANSASTSTAVSVTVTAPAPTVTFAVAPTSVVLGKTATLTWSSTNATACSAAGAWMGTQATSGTLIVTPTAAGTLTYSLDCANAAGVKASGSATLTVTAPAPTVTISVSPTSLTVGQSATLTWSSTNASSCTASNAWTGSEAISGTMTVTPSAAGSLSYALACTGTGGTANGTAALTVNAAPSKSGGGGSTGLWDLLALALLGAIRYRRRASVLQRAAR